MAFPAAFYRGFCTNKLYAVQRGKGSVRFLEAMWKYRNYDSRPTLHQLSAM